MRAQFEKSNRTDGLISMPGAELTGRAGLLEVTWRGVAPLNIAAQVKYLTADEGGVSHFRYGRDNVLLTWMHLRLMLEFLLRLPWLLFRRLTGRPD